MKNFCVITTIQAPTEAVKEWHKRFGDNLILIGDKKTPDIEGYGKYFSFADQEILNTNLVLPENHYARKNFGYLVAIKGGAELIYDTDDDNEPSDNWKIRRSNCTSQSENKSGWCNAYRLLINDDYYIHRIWPRGLPLNKIHSSYASTLSHDSDRYELRYSPIQQGMANGEADVDAIFRLVHECPHGIDFESNISIYLSPKSWCPFNSQSTWFFPEAFPLLYLPIYAPFRMTDIWRSFVAQRCLWAMGYGVTFHSPAEVFQKRNEHDLLKDFEGEIQGYLRNDEIVETLTNLKLGKDVFENMVSCYRSLIEIKVLPEEEMHSLLGWITELKSI
jgi:hypothetical protein